jgi:anti-sigma B factor antagonist
VGLIYQGYFDRPKGKSMATIRHELMGEIRVIFIDTERLLDGPSIDVCHREIIAVLDKTQEPYVLLHFGRVTFMSSAALGMLIRINKKCTEFKIMLKLCNIAPDIRQVFKITGIDKVLEIHADAAHAMEAFKKSGKLTFRKSRDTSYEVT